jgi:hypothetical protein
MELPFVQFAEHQFRIKLPISRLKVHLRLHLKGAGLRQLKSWALLWP